MKALFIIIVSGFCMKKCIPTYWINVDV